jgi:hypothetical protein
VKRLKPLAHYLRSGVPREVPPPTDEERKTVVQAAALLLKRLTKGR